MVMMMMIKAKDHDLTNVLVPQALKAGFHIRLNSAANMQYQTFCDGSII